MWTLTEKFKPEKKDLRANRGFQGEGFHPESSGAVMLGLNLAGKSFLAAGLLAVAGVWAGGPYVEQVPKFDRKKSSATVRKIANPTPANLDCAAYFKNPLRYDPDPQKPGKTPDQVEIQSIQFEGLLVQPVNSLEETPLTDTEKSSPMAWTPLQNHLWDQTKDPAFAEMTGKINGYKWADPEVFKAYQEITAAYLHQGQAGMELWVQIDFSPWVGFLKNVSDEDGDGYREVFGRLNLEGVKQETWEKSVRWMQSEYLTKTLSDQEVQDWAQTLASYWYPSLNTDFMEAGKVWPDAGVEKEIRKKLGTFSVKNPTVVIRGNPFGKPIYNIFLVEGDAKGAAASASETGDSKKSGSDLKRSGSTGKTPDAKAAGASQPSQNFTAINAFLDEQSKARGGYQRWHQSLQPFRNDVSNTLKGLPPEQLAVPGKDSWLFFRRSLEYLLAGDLTGQKPEKNPLPHIVRLQEFLNSQGVSMIFVPVPSKAEVYFDRVSHTKPATEWVHPYGRKFLKDLQSAGVEVIDLLPRFLNAKKEDAKHGETLYQLHDTHWTTRGLVIAAQAISERIKAYPWYASLIKENYSQRDTLTSRRGDIVDKLPEMQRKDYPAVDLKATQVLDSKGKLYRTDKNASIILMGDSYTGVYELIDCKSAGVGAHISAGTGLPLDIITSWGGGPLVRQKLLRARQKQLKDKKLVIYMMTARDLYNYSQSWKPLKIKGK